MTFAEIVANVAHKLNLKSPQAIADIGKDVNKRYRRLTTSLGLDVTTQNTKAATCTIGNRYLIFTETLKVIALYDAASNVPPIREASMDELRNSSAGRTGKAQQYAVARMGANTVTLYLDATPTFADIWTADIYEKTGILSGVMVPVFDENFHDILELGAKADQLKKMEKPQLAAEAEADAEARKQELVFFIARSAYLSRYQGKNNGNISWRNYVPLA